MRQHVLIIGGGLAGLAAATALAPHGFRVTILESRGRLGGRAASFVDSGSGQLIDNCQHVSMGCCTEFMRFCRTVGIDRYLQVQPCLYFMTPDGKVSRLRADHLPAPLHLARSFLSAHYLTAVEKARVLWGLMLLRDFPPRGDAPFLDWLLAHRQTQRAIDRFWAVVLTSALNETIDRIGLRAARKVFVDGFLADRRGCEVLVPAVPLSRLYGDEMLRWFNHHGVSIQLNAGAKGLQIAGGRVHSVTLRSSENGLASRPATADWYISAVPFNRLLEMLTCEIVEQHIYFAQLRELETSPISSVHLWYDRPVLELPHVVLLDCLGQWVFNRGETAPGEHYVQVVVSAARMLRGLGHEEAERRIHEELKRLFPAIEQATLLRSRAVTEHAATFSAVPGVDRWRPTQRSPIENLFIAGDWTATGWPATMESAVRSGYLSAEALRARASGAA